MERKIAHKYSEWLIMEVFWASAKFLNCKGSL